MSRDPFFDAIRERLLPDATDTEIESLFGQYLGAQPEDVPAHQATRRQAPEAETLPTR